MIAAALLLLIVIAPSHGASGGGAPSYPAFTATGPSAAPGTTSSGTSAQGGGTKQGTAGGRRLAAGAGGGATGSGATGSAGGNGTTTATGHGNTKHCVGGKQFAVAGFAAAPPCQPTWSGNNGGATYQGVTAKQITVVYYSPKDSLALHAILGPAGLDPTAAQNADYLARAQSFINARYQLWGRQVRMINYVSKSCQASPPSDDCFRQDAHTIVSTYHPFAVVYSRNITAPGFQQELSHLGVINFGGMNLPASFDTSQAPYHYDYDMDGDTQAVLAGEYYCKELANRPARYAGPALRSKPRKAEILVEDTPEHVVAAQHLQAIIDHCDHGGGAVIKTFAPDTGQAVVQTTTLASQAKQSGITTLLYFTDPVFPVYLTPQLTAQDYFPENVVIGSSYLDFDELGQLYSKQQWAHAFGLGDLPDMSSLSNYDAGAVYRSTHGKLGPFVSANNMQGDLSVLAAGLQQAGPTLNPATFQRAVLTLPAWGGSRYHALVKYGAGDYTGVSDVRRIYWDPSRRSPVDGKPGTYVALDNGRRYTIGQLPSGTFTIPGR
ncbi:MAG TPA: hypothetical protein VG708_14940 [Mycobacteriales bacterium]|nr:hypothetical protein [Mycobacteriales bacterium]